MNNDTDILKCTAHLPRHTHISRSLSLPLSHTHTHTHICAHPRTQDRRSGTQSHKSSAVSSLRITFHTSCTLTNSYRYTHPCRQTHTHKHTTTQQTTTKPHTHNTATNRT